MQTSHQRVGLPVIDDDEQTQPHVEGAIGIVQGHVAVAGYDAADAAGA